MKPSERFKELKEEIRQKFPDISKEKIACYESWFNEGAEANLWLINDLYEALQGLLGDIMEYQSINNLGGENNHWQVKARAALAKAEEAK
jgi:hypothetical protein